MTDELQKLITDQIRLAVKETVNGKVDALHNEVREYREEMKPILQAYQGGKVLGELVKWLAAVGLAVLAIKGFFK